MSLHDVPEPVEILDVVSALLSQTVVRLVPLEHRMDVIAAAELLAIVRRRLAVGADHERNRLGRLIGLGVTDERGLADAINEGRHDADCRRPTAGDRPKIPP